MTDDEVGQRMRRWRKAAGWTQQQVANHVGIGQTAWSRVETGRRTLSFAEGLAFATALKVDVLALTRDPLDVLQNAARTCRRGAA